jgi:hypothetical protein
MMGSGTIAKANESHGSHFQTAAIISSLLFARPETAINLPLTLALVMTALDVSENREGALPVKRLWKQNRRTV